MGREGYCQGANVMNHTEKREFLDTAGLAVLEVDDKRSKDLIVKYPRGIHIYHQPLDEILKASNIFVITSLSRLSEVANIVIASEKQRHLRGLFVHINVEPSFMNKIFDDAKIRITEKVIMHSNLELPNRVLKAWQTGSQEELIAEATVVVNDLFVRDCALNSWRIPFDMLPSLAKIPPEERSNFELDEDGSYIYWPSADIHLDMEVLRAAVDKERQDKLNYERVIYDQYFGVAVALVRKAHNIRQTDIVGISERHIRRIERGERPKLETLRKLAQAHGINLNDYLEEIAQTVSKLKESTSLS